MLLLGEIYARLEYPLAQKLAKSHAFPIERILRGAPKSHLSRREREIERDEQQSMNK